MRRSAAASRRRVARARRGAVRSWPRTTFAPGTRRSTVATRAYAAQPAAPRWQATTWLPGDPAGGVLGDSPTTSRCAGPSRRSWSPPTSRGDSTTAAPSARSARAPRWRSPASSRPGRPAGLAGGQPARRARRRRARRAAGEPADARRSRRRSGPTRTNTTRSTTSSCACGAHGRRVARRARHGYRHARRPLSAGAGPAPGAGVLMLGARSRSSTPWRLHWRLLASCRCRRRRRRGAGAATRRARSASRPRVCARWRSPAGGARGVRLLALASPQPAGAHDDRDASLRTDVRGRVRRRRLALDARVRGCRAPRRGSTRARRRRTTPRRRAGRPAGSRVSPTASCRTSSRPLDERSLRATLARSVTVGVAAAAERRHGRDVLRGARGARADGFFARGRSTAPACSSPTARRARARTVDRARASCRPIARSDRRR